MNFVNRLQRPALLLIGFLIIQISFSQQNFVPGFVIENSGDTIYGLIDYRNWNKNPDEIKFKLTNENEPVNFKPNDIIEFQINDDRYVSGIVDTEISPSGTNVLSNNPQLNIVVDTIFLQSLVSGIKSLYYFKDARGKENFYYKEEDNFELLIYKKYTKKVQGHDIFSENKTYLGQLTIYLADCKTIQSKLENTFYNSKSLIKLFQYYYECSSTKISFKKEEGISLEFGALAGITSTSLKFGGDAFTYLTNTNYNNSTNFSAGLFFDIVLPRNHGKLSFSNELLFTNYFVQGKNEVNVDIDYYTITSTEIGFSYLSLKNLIRYKYPIGPLFLFINAGISNGMATSEKNYMKEESYFYGTERVKEELAVKEIRKIEQAYLLGTGIRYSKFSFEARFEKGNGMENYLDLYASVKRFYFLLGYRF